MKWRSRGVSGEPRFLVVCRYAQMNNCVKRIKRRRYNDYVTNDQ